MKKYLWALLPVTLTGVLAVVFAFLEPDNEFAHPLRTRPWLDYFSSTWFLIGVVLGLVVVSILLIEDFFEYIQRKRKRP